MAPPLSAIRHADQSSAPPVNEGEYNVNILLSRHGISCANMVQMWGDGSLRTWTRRVMSMTDPLLSAVGELKTQEAAEEVKRNMDKQGLTLDAVLSSVLARAIHTALLQYPGSVITPVPFIREKGQLSADNSVMALDGQLKVLRAAMGNQTIAIDPHYTEDWPFKTFRTSSGNWMDFLTFLKDAFLPDLVVKKDKKPGDTITIAVVTHSHFMMGTQFFEGKNGDCSFWWFPDGEGSQKRIPRNNQVVKLAYHFKVNNHNANSRVNQVRSIEALPTCDMLADGVPLFDKRGKIPICNKDLGSQCLAQAGASAPKTLEKMYEDKLLVQTQLELDPHGDELEIAVLAKRLSIIENTPCWSGGFPEVPQKPARVALTPQEAF